MKNINIKNIFPFILTLVLLFMMGSCGNGEKQDTLTAQKIEAYLKAYKELRDKVPDMLNKANSGAIEEGEKSNSDFESVLKNYGLTYKEFLVINAKVGAVFSVINAQDFMSTMENMKTQGIEQMDAGMKQMQDQINDPNLPKEAKEEMSKALEEMQKARADIKNEFEKNKEWADLVLNKTKTLTNLFISSEDAALVKQYFDKISEAYAGGVLPTKYTIN